MFRRPPEVFICVSDDGSGSGKSPIYIPVPFHIITIPITIYSIKAHLSTLSIYHANSWSVESIQHVYITMVKLWEWPSRSTIGFSFLLALGYWSVGWTSAGGPVCGEPCSPAVKVHATSPWQQFWYKICLSVYMASHYEDKTATRPSFLCKGHHYTVKMACLY